MAKGKKNVETIGVSGESSGTVTNANRDGIGQTGESGVSTIESGRGDTEGNGSDGKRKDRSNPPVYGIVGVRPYDEGMDLLATFPTLHQMKKNLAMVKRMVTRSYSALEYVKIKYLDMSDVES